MAQERLVKCPSCKESFPKSTTKEHGKRYYCRPCYEEKMKPKERTAWDDLYDTIKHYYGAVTPIMFRQLKQFREEPHYKFTDVGMRLTLIYYHEILGRPVLEEHQTLAIIPYVYDDAKRYYTEVYRLSELTTRQVFEAKQQERFTNARPKSKKSVAFDFNSIDWEDEINVAE